MHLRRRILMAACIITSSLLCMSGRAHAHGGYGFTLFDIILIYLILDAGIILVLAPVIFILLIVLRFDAPMLKKIRGAFACAAFAVVLGMVLLFARKGLGLPDEPLTRPSVAVIMLAFPFFARWFFQESAAKLLALDALVCTPFFIAPKEIIIFIVRAIMG